MHSVAVCISLVSETRGVRSHIVEIRYVKSNIPPPRHQFWNLRRVC